MPIEIAVYDIDYAQKTPDSRTSSKYGIKVGTTNPISTEEFRALAQVLLSRVPDNLPPEQIRQKILSDFAEKGFKEARYHDISGDLRVFGPVRRE